MAISGKKHKLTIAGIMHITLGNVPQSTRANAAQHFVRPDACTFWRAPALWSGGWKCRAPNAMHRAP